MPTSDPGTTYVLAELEKEARRLVRESRCDCGKRYRRDGEAVLAMLGTRTPALRIGAFCTNCHHRTILTEAI